MRPSTRAFTKCVASPARSPPPPCTANCWQASAIRASHLVGDERVQDPVQSALPAAGDGRGDGHHRATCRPHPADRSECRHRQSADFRLRPEEIISGGNFHAEPVAFAADTLALAIAEIGGLAERRIALLDRRTPCPACRRFWCAEPGVNSGFMIAHVTAAALASENKSLAHPASVDSLPTSANQEDHVSMATFAARRLDDMAHNTAVIIGIELLAAAQGIDFHRPLATSQHLEHVHAQQCAPEGAVFRRRPFLRPRYRSGPP